MSAEQRETLDAILRQSAFPAGSDVDEQRRLLRELISAQPLPADVTVTAAALGGVPTAEITVDGIEPRHVVLYFHGGVYVIGDAFLAADLASQVGRRTQAKVISVDYRLAPEHPYPAAVDDALAAYEALLHNGIAPSDIAFAGESAGGGLAIATLVNARDHGLPLPAAAFVMSPYADLTLAGTTMETRREVDPLLSREALQARVTDYTAGQDAALGLISPVFADLSGLPPLIIQAGTHEVLLDDALRLARQAATADVEVTLDITPGVPHVFQAYYPILDEAAAALDRAGQFLSAHLAGAERVTGERKAERKLLSHDPEIEGSNPAGSGSISGRAAAVVAGAGPQVAGDGDADAPTATARTALCPIGAPVSRPRSVSMTGVNGWFSANQRTPAGMEPVGTKALLTNGSTTMSSARLFAPAGVLATSPNATVSQVRANVSSANTPIAASHSSGVGGRPEAERRPRPRRRARR